MKKYFLFFATVALLSLAGCTKQNASYGTDREISFQVANYVPTKANVAFSNKDFGTFAWHHATDGAVTPFMENEQVGQKGTEWKTLNNTFYWPKTGSINFISYSPYKETGTPAVTENSVKFAAYTVGEEDLMYADRATEKTQNESTYTAISGANGVPTLFHHALAKLSFKVKAAFLEWEGDDANKSKTSWKITLKSISFGGVYNTGDLNLTLASNKTSWETPGWVPDKSKKADAVELVTAKDGMELTTEAQDLFDGKSFYVLPQTLAAGAQQMKLNLAIVTTLPNKDENGENRVVNEVYEATLDLQKISSLKSWGMNQNIVYTINVKPTASDPTDPHPDDPEDVIITFDPAQADWVKVETNAIIQI